MISYAQNGEDVVVARAFEGASDGIYVDVGAGHPMLDSVTKHFYDLGWHGLNVEPGLHEFHALVTERPRDVSLNVAVGNRRETRTFYETPRNSGLSSFSLEHLLAQGIARDEVTSREIDVVPLGDILDEYFSEQQIDFLKVDVEGAEDEAIESVDWRRHRPRVLVLEAFYVTKQALLDGAGYRQTLWDGINTFWVRSEDEGQLGHRLSYPASTVLDSYDPWHYVQQIHLARRDGCRSVRKRVLGAAQRLRRLRSAQG